ncbi:MAG: hypothetical protein V1734_01830 [Nanoarchaeota archaeon]
MDMTYKIIIAVIAGLLVFTLMIKMTKWIFRGIILLLFIGGLFYAYSHIDDMKAVFNDEMGDSEALDASGVMPAVRELNETIQNVTEEIIIVEPIEEPAELEQPADSAQEQGEIDSEELSAQA